MSNVLPPELGVGGGGHHANVINATSLFYFLLAPAVLLWFIYWKLSRRHLVELGNKLPGPKPLPVIGNLMTVLGSPHSKNQSLSVPPMKFPPSNSVLSQI